MSVTDGAGAARADTGVGASTPTPFAIITWMGSVNPVYQLLGIELIEARPGFTRFVMPVSKDISNTFGVAHGGMVFAFADVCFGFTANATHNTKAVSSSAEIHWLSSGRVGDRLIGETTEVWQKGRNGLYDVRIISETTGELIALVHGRMRFIGGAVVEAA